MKLKRCWNCERSLPGTAFNLNRSRADGLADECRECSHHRAAENYRRIMASPSARRRRRELAHLWYRTEKAQQIVKAYRTLPEVRARQRAANREYWTHGGKARRQQRFANETATQRERRLARLRKATARYRQTTNGRKQGREDQRRRKARIRGATVVTLTRVQWEAIKEQHRHRCFYCRKKCLRLTQDHVIPVSKGGQHAKENIVPACMSCNARKKDKILTLF